MSRYFVTAARGVEPLTAKELEQQGATKTEIVPGGVYFEGSQETLYRAHLWLRTGNRIFLPLREFQVRDPEELYQHMLKFKWETFFRDDRLTFAVDCTISGRTLPALNHSQFAKLKIKDAIVDRLREKTGTRPSVNVENPDISIVEYIIN
jgi:23S rRNA G2445 N2-methylase RlmL